MALEGSLTDFGLADILQLIYFQRKTGVLALEGKMDKVRVLFIEGNISGAESKRRLDDNRLGKILVKKGIIKDADLQSALEEQRKTGAKLGNVFIKKDLVKKELIIDILTNQINETVIQLFTWKQGTYEFSAQGIPQDKDIPFSIDTQHLLMEGLRILDEWSLIQGKITLNTVFSKKTESPVGLTDEEKEIFAYVDGENDVSTIIDLSAKDNFEVSKTLLALIDKGIVAGVEAAPVVVQGEITEVKRSLPFAEYLPFAAVIISLLLAIGGVLTHQSQILKVIQASEHIENLRFKIETYKIEHSVYPQALDEISRTRDPWGRAYIYRTTDTALYYLASAGPDGKEDSADDIY